MRVAVAMLAALLKRVFICVVQQSMLLLYLQLFVMKAIMYVCAYVCITYKERVIVGMKRFLHDVYCHNKTICLYAPEGYRLQIKQPLEFRIFLSRQI